MRDVMLLKNPVAEPGVCCKCGSQNKDWFVDIGIDVEGKHLPGEEYQETVPFIWFEGVFYLCCDCYNSLVTDLTRRWDQFAKDNYIETEPARTDGYEQRVPDSSSGDTEDAESNGDEIDGDTGSTSGTPEFAASVPNSAGWGG